MHLIFENHNVCKLVATRDLRSQCGKHQDLTSEEVEKQKKRDPQIKQKGVDCYLEYPFCQGGYMFSREDGTFHRLTTDLFDE